MGISVVSMQGLWWMTRLFAQASEGAIGSVYRSLAVSVRWISGRRRQHEVVVVRCSLEGDAIVAARICS